MPTRTDPTDSPAVARPESGVESGGAARPPAWLWLGLPAAVLPLQLAVLQIRPELDRAWLRGELGLFENLTLLFLVLAVVAGARLLRARRAVRWRLFGPFAAVMTLGCLFFAGEEASWGQHLLGFAPPETIAARNDQGEFNLHNDPLFENLLDQLPRTLLSLAALVGGVIAPLVLRRRGPRRFMFEGSTPWGWVWPTATCTPAALLALLVSMPKKLWGAFAVDVPSWADHSSGELKELGLAIFLFLYLEVLRRELAAARRRDPG